jgi:sugar phosphate isomerase/epimerase
MSFCLSTHLLHAERLNRSHLEIAASHGFRDIEVFATRTHFDYHDARHIAELGRWLAELGMVAGSMHAPICTSCVGGEWGRAFSNAAVEPARRSEAVAETVTALEAARQLGCGAMVLHLGLPRTQDVPPGDNDMRAVRRSLETLRDAAAGAGVPLALEVLPNDLSRPDVLLELLESLELQTAGICLDFGHAHLLGGAPEAAETLSGQVTTTHVHDNLGTLDNHLVPFDGNIDWPRTLTAMWKIGYAGRYVFEVADHGDARATLERTVGARTRLQAILDGLGEPFPFKEED